MKKEKIKQAMETFKKWHTEAINRNDFIMAREMKECYKKLKKELEKNEIDSI
jgi:hypothetical protein